jgi:Rps23 Pro-64 3,4-dihydroxylase Tpa1-like proline 4-hydroxylase
LDQNNLQDGQKLRKITVIAYLNPEIPALTGQKGELRLYLKDKIIDVMPRIGRIIVFRSEIVEHEVKPTKGYQRFALTTWYRHIHHEEEKKCVQIKSEIED